MYEYEYHNCEGRLQPKTENISIIICPRINMTLDDEQDRDRDRRRHACSQLTDTVLITQLLNAEQLHNQQSMHLAGRNGPRLRDLATAGVPVENRHLALDHVHAQALLGPVAREVPVLLGREVVEHRV